VRRPSIGGEDDLTALLALPGADRLPEVYGYWGELGGAAKARDLGALGAGGDLFADGALGSRTAHLRQPYTDEPGSAGHGYVTAAQVAEHLVGCTEHEIQGGFHAIGDAAIGTVLAGFALAAARVGLDRLRARRHRIEHVEMVDKALIGGLVEFGVVASMQPAFDRLWGGTDRMYALRLGRTGPWRPTRSRRWPASAWRWRSAPTPGDAAGPVGVGAGRVQPPQPQPAADVRQAFAAHTRGGWRAVHRDGDGVLAPGAPATLAVWDGAGELHRGLPALTDGPDGAPPPKPTCRLTVLRGTAIYWT
jgi:predicted amidohydrolase YtcJ